LIVTLTFFSMLFWAFAQQGGSSISPYIAVNEAVDIKANRATALLCEGPEQQGGSSISLYIDRFVNRDMKANRATALLCEGPEQ
ncbi:hypothetical protein PSY30_23445, partial [Shigella flexneri]|nr:hypothetical protein [Shigella flexneri]